MKNPKKLIGDVFEFYLDERGFYYLRLREGEEFEMGHVAEIQRYIKEVLGGVLKPFLIEFGYGSTIGEDVQNHLVNSHNRYSTADAILISTYAHQLISKFYMRKYKPTKPTKIFDNIFDALEWLKKAGVE